MDIQHAFYTNTERDNNMNIWCAFYTSGGSDDMNVPDAFYTMKGAAVVFTTKPAVLLLTPLRLLDHFLHAVYQERLLRL